jgi:4-hydroxybenzoyl-CoA thioesterase
VSAPFTMRQRLRFQDCDPAGIAYYPRYLALCDAVIEEWTEAVVGVARRRLHQELDMGLPTVSLEADFAAMSRLGDWLDFELSATALGRASVDLKMEVSCAGERRFGVRYKQVLVDMGRGKATAWPAEWRARIANFMGAPV